MKPTAGAKHWRSMDFPRGHEGRCLAREAELRATEGSRHVEAIFQLVSSFPSNSEENWYIDILLPASQESKHLKKAQMVFLISFSKVGRGEQVCEMFSRRFPEPCRRRLGSQSTEEEWELFGALQRAHSAYKRLPGGRPTWGVAGAGKEHEERWDWEVRKMVYIAKEERTFDSYKGGLDYK